MRTCSTCVLRIEIAVVYKHLHCSFIFRQYHRMATVRRSRSGPLAQCYSTDVIVVSQPAADAAGPSIKRDRFSFGIGAMHRTSGSMGIDLDNAEWEKKVMNSWPKMCTFVVREILQTERAYIASLEEIILVRNLRVAS